jgi:hypothetical protein
MEKQERPLDLWAELMNPDGTIERVSPAGNRWELYELHNLVGGYIQVVYLFPTLETELCALVNEDGHRLELPINRGASLLLSQIIKGPAVIIRSALLDY